MEPQVETKNGKPGPAHPGRWQGIGAHVIKFPGSVEDATLEIEMAASNAERTFDALFRKHLTRLRQAKRQAQQVVSARLRYLHRQAAQTVRAMFVADREQQSWPGSDAMELVRSVAVSTILARAKVYAEAVGPESAWRNATRALC